MKTAQVVLKAIPDNVGPSVVWGLRLASMGNGKAVMLSELFKNNATKWIVTAMV
jgi:hypothetical protein